MIDIKNTQLFSITLSHKYATDNVCKDFLIVPSVQTKQVLGNHRIVVRQIENVLYAGIDLNTQSSVQQPLIVPEEGVQLTFFLLLNNPLFYNYTSIPNIINRDSLYYFTNRNTNNNADKNNFLTQALPVYSSGATYSFEDLVIDADIVYQSLKNVNVNNPLTDSIYWRKVDTNRFATAADLVSWLPPIFNYPLNPVTPTIDIEVKGYAGNGNYTLSVLRQTIANPKLESSFALDLSALANGKYFLFINGSVMPVPIYLNKELANQKVFGMVDIFIESGLADGYKILDATKNLVQNPPKYIIYFLNRATFWKYILIRKSEATIEESDDIYKFTTTVLPNLPTTITSQLPIPLNENPMLKLSLDGQDKPRPPCANAGRLAKIGLEPPYYSEIYLNY